MRLICRIIMSRSIHYFGVGLWGSYQQNSQMAPILSKLNSYLIYLDSLFQSDFTKVSTLLSSFFTSGDRGIEGRGQFSPSLIVPLLPSATHLPYINSATILNHAIPCSHIFSLEANIVSPSMTSQANSPYSSLLLGHGRGKGQFHKL